MCAKSYRIDFENVCVATPILRKLTGMNSDFSILGR
jgi:hypothetical protein